MPVKTVPTLAWTRGDVEATIRLVSREQREQIAMRVREAMDRDGLTNAALAYKAGVSEKTISRLINAKLEPRYDTLDRIAKALGMTERDLRGEQRPPLGLVTDELLGPDDRIGEVLERLTRLEEALEGIRLRQLDAAAHAVEVLRRLDEMPPPSSRTQAPPPP